MVLLFGRGRKELGEELRFAGCRWNPLSWLVLAVDAGMCWSFVLGNVVLVVGGNWDFPG